MYVLFFFISIDICSCQKENLGLHCYRIQCSLYTWCFTFGGQSGYQDMLLSYKKHICNPQAPPYEQNHCCRNSNIFNVCHNFNMCCLLLCMLVMLVERIREVAACSENSKLAYLEGNPAL